MYGSCGQNNFHSCVPLTGGRGAKSMGIFRKAGTAVKHQFLRFFETKNQRRLLCLRKYRHQQGHDFDERECQKSEMSNTV